MADMEIFTYLPMRVFVLIANKDWAKRLDKVDTASKRVRVRANICQLPKPSTEVWLTEDVGSIRGNMRS
jgi:hypothetical protein